MVLRWAFVVPFAVLALPGCSSDENTGSPPTTSEARDGELAEFSGVLKGDLDCLWIEFVGGERHALVFSKGTETKESDDQVVLLSADGEEIARAGDDVVLTGGFRLDAESCVDGEEGAIVTSEVSRQG